jgi:hypothetical protein
MDPQPAPAPAPMSAPAPVSAPVSSGSYISAPHLLVKPGWEGLKPNLGVYLGTYLAIIAVVLVVAVIGGILTAIFHWLGLLIGLVIAIIGFLALARLIVAPYRVLLAAAKREKITFNQATTSPEGFAVRFLLTGILLGLILVVGFVLLIIPGLWLLV